uniref:Uncharacterized protein n=1 Tax=Timema poppense TaxID=170557 RepID=A0A7R9D793_TIMPO|nr:unnamed protein product [Timema poppensis]
MLPGVPGAVHHGCPERREMVPVSARSATTTRMFPAMNRLCSPGEPVVPADPRRRIVFSTEELSVARLFLGPRTGHVVEAPGDDDESFRYRITWKSSGQPHPQRINNPTPSSSSSCARSISFSDLYS